MNKRHRELAERLAETLDELQWAPLEDCAPTGPDNPNGRYVRGFNMEFSTYAGTSPADLAHWTLHVAAELGMMPGEPEVLGLTGECALENAGEALGLTPEQTGRLFRPTLERDGVSAQAKIGEKGWIRAGHAAACIRRLAKEGVIDWRDPEEQELEDYYVKVSVNAEVFYRVRARSEEAARSRAGDLILDPQVRQPVVDDVYERGQLDCEAEIVKPQDAKEDPLTCRSALLDEMREEEEEGGVIKIT